MPLPHKAGAADYSVEMSEKNGEVGGGVGDSRRGRVTPNRVRRCPLLFAWGVGSDG